MNLIAYGKSTKSHRNTLDALKNGGARRTHEQKLRLFMKTAAATTAWLEEKVSDACRTDVTLFKAMGGGLGLHSRDLGVAWCWSESQSTEDCRANECSGLHEGKGSEQR